MNWTTELRKVSTLKEWDQNPRKITDAQFEALKEAITKRGFHDVIKIDTDGTIVSGHQRKRALTDLGIKEVWVIVPDRPLTEEERKAVAIESNLHRGQFDFDILGNNFDVAALLELGMTEYDLNLIPSSGSGALAIENALAGKDIDAELPTEHKCPNCGYEY